jgi:4-oxalocrotonate tautomerase
MACRVDFSCVSQHRSTTIERMGAMPLLNVKVIENVFSDEQKKQMVERLTDAMVSIEGENMRGVTWVIVEEVRSGQWGIGGNALTTEDVRALASGVPVG